MTKRILLAAAMLIGMHTMASAQGQHRKGDFKNMTIEQRAEKQTERMQQALQLDEKQKKAVYDLNLESMRKMQEQRKENKADFMAMRKERDAKLKNILTKEQFAKLEAKKAERKNREHLNNRRTDLKMKDARQEVK